MIGSGGGAFTEVEAPPVAIVSRALARMLWGDTSAVGKQIEVFTLRQQWQRFLLVGVAEDVRSRVLDRPTLEIYFPQGAGGVPLPSYVVKHAAGRPVTESMVRRALADVDPDLALDAIQTTRAVVDRVLAPARLLSTAMSMLGMTGLTLLALGIFGAAATTLRMARKEVAIRQAIGATPFKAARAPLRSMIVAVVVGAALGGAAAPAALRLLAAVGVADPSALVPALVWGSLAVAAAATLAIILTIRPAMNAPPAELLRAE